MKASPKLNMLEYIASQQKKQIYVNQMFSTIAPRYDSVTTVLSYGQDRRWKRNLVEMAALKADDLVLDLACGTGDITFLVAGRLTQGKVIGVDITPRMIDIAKQKRAAGQVDNADFQIGDICHLSFPDDSFDCVTVGYGVRNVPDIPQLLKEVYRLLKPGGLFLSLDFGRPSSRLYRWACLRYLSAVGSLLGWLLHGDPDVYRYIAESLRLYPGHLGVEQLMEKQGFVQTGFTTFLAGVTAINLGRKPVISASSSRSSRLRG